MGDEGLRAQVGVVLGALDLDVTLESAPGAAVAVVGPNGAGKTTLLRAVAGLQRLDRGVVALDGTVLDEPATGTWVPTDQRPIGFVFADHRLFDHLSALDNVAFGLRCRGASRGAAGREAAGWLDRVGLAALASAKPPTLSAGQSQLVALARTLATGPRVLLLDEPLSALDVVHRAEVRRVLRRHLDEFAGVRVLVTHDPVEAMVMADRLVVVEGGRVVQSGTATEISRRPKSPYVADLVGLNLYRGQADGRRIRLDGGGELTVAEDVTGAVLVTIRPTAVSLHRRRPDGTPRNVWPATVVGIEAGPDRVRVQVGGPVAIVAEVTSEALADLDLHHGSEAWVAVKATDVGVDLA